MPRSANPNAPGSSASPRHVTKARDVLVKPALLIIDMISSWDFPDADKLLPHALAIAPRIARLRLRCRRAGVPVIYANDNQGRWRSDFRQLVERASAPQAPGAAITSLLAPSADDYFVLKPKHSGFFCTPLELLLQQLQVGTLALTGVASDQCITTTAAEARMRDYVVIVPADCVALQSARRNQAAIDHFRVVMKIATTPSARLRLNRTA